MAVVKKRRRRRRRTVTTVNPGQRIKSVARGFRLAFRDLGVQRKLSVTATTKITNTIDADRGQLKLAKLLYSRHPALSGKNKVKNKLKALFEALTLPYPEAGVRLLPVRAESAEDQAKEVEAFIETINTVVHGEYREAIAELQDKWPDVLKKCQDDLRELYSAADYPAAEHLPKVLAVTLDPVNIELPEYYKQLAPAEYRRASEALAAKFEEAAAMQEQYIIDTFRATIDQMVSSISGFHDGKQKLFRNSVVENVFAAIAEFNTKCKAFGILSGSDLEREFDNLHKVMTGDGDATGATVAKDLRDSSELRKDMVSKLSSISSTIAALATNRPRRSILVE